MQSAEDDAVRKRRRLVGPSTPTDKTESVLVGIPEIRVSVTDEPPTLSKPTENEWTPEFSHQCFPGGRVDGFATPRLRAWYRDPDLTWVGAFSSSSRDQSRAVDMHAALDLVVPPGSRVEVIENAVDWPALRLPADVRLKADWAPPGKRVAEYSKGGRSYVIHRWELEGSAEIAALHGRMETLAVWLIETASRVDATDPRWSVFGVYACRSDAGPAAYSFVGFATVYLFTNPLRRERPDALRLAQVVVLPPYQRSGHGGRILDAVAAFADEIDAFEVTVESPCEGMARLRDAHDAGRALAASASLGLPELAFAAPLAGDKAAPSVAAAEGAAPPAKDQGAAPSVTTADGAAAALPELDAAGAAALHRALRITVPQAHRAHEALLLATLCARHKRDGSGDPLTDEEALRPFRLLVKRRIFLGDADIRAISDVDARKAALEEAWQDCLAQHVMAGRRLGLLASSEGAAAVVAYTARLQAALAQAAAEEEQEGQGS